MDFQKVFICFSFLFIQSITGQCYPNALAADLPFAVPYGPMASPCIGPAIGPIPNAPLPANMPPPGMSIYSDNLVIEGPVVVAGRMPFTGTVAVEGAFPTVGAGAVTYGCGDDGIGILAEMPTAPIGSPFEYGVIDGFAFNSLAPPNLGCGPRVIY